MHDLVFTTLHRAAWSEADLSAELDDMHVGQVIVLKGPCRDRMIRAIAHAEFYKLMTFKLQYRLKQGQARV